MEQRMLSAAVVVVDCGCGHARNALAFVDIVYALEPTASMAHLVGRRV
jgi:hypothetical protein